MYLGLHHIHHGLDQIGGRLPMKASHVNSQQSRYRVIHGASKPRPLLALPNTARGVRRLSVIGASTRTHRSCLTSLRPTSPADSLLVAFSSVRSEQLQMPFDVLNKVESSASKRGSIVPTRFTVNKHCHPQPLQTLLPTPLFYSYYTVRLS